MTARASTAAESAESAEFIDSPGGTGARSEHDRTASRAREPGSRSRDGKEPVRINLTLSPRTASRLEELKETTDAASTAEVVRSALRVYDFVVEQVAEGNEVCIRAPDGTITATKIFL